MNKFYSFPAILIVIFVSFSFNSFAGDTPCGATPLANNMTTFETYSNLGNTGSGVEAPFCGNYITADIWFSVTAPANGMLDIVTLAGGMINGAMAFYEGPCDDLTQLYCMDDDNCGNSIMPIMQLDDLTPFATYYIRIWAENGAPNGDFQIRVSNGPLPVPPVPTTALVGTAFNTEINGLDCVQLTTASAGQAGCAWDPDQVDMNQPFDVTLSLNFGNSNAGADGICWVFQSDPAGLNACGTTGQNIAGNISNSFIIEMDTYDNGPGFGDIPGDHIAVNINGDMGNPINGANPLGEIEDGQEHEVRFVWDPGSNFYQVYFDGTLQISGVYDIITNCLNGNPFCYWGFTASTGGAVNNQTICPVAEPQYPAGDESIVEVEICEGESYFAGGGNQTTSGLYTDYYAALNGCDSIVNTDLTVIPSSEFEYDAVVCVGECETVGPNTFCNSGVYDVVFEDANYLGCDSIVTLNLIVLDPQVVIWPPDPLDCFNTTAILDGTLSTSSPGVISYSWVGPSPGCVLSGGNTSIALVDCPGIYTLTIEQTFGNTTCTASNTVVVEDNGQFPDADAGINETLNCEVACVVIGGTGSSTGPNISYSWVGPNNFTSGDQFPFVCVAGFYTLSVIDLNTGCISTDNVEVFENIDLPIADAGLGDTLTCDQTSVTLDGSNSSIGPEFSYEWTLSGGPVVGDEPIIDVTETGVYILVVTDNSNGCSASSTVEVGENIDTPTADAGIDETLTCDEDDVTLQGSGGGATNLSFEWQNSNGDSIGNEENLIIDQAGDYIFIVINDDNGCTAIDTASVLLDANVPVADAGNNGLLTCEVLDWTLDGSNSTGGNLVFEWQDESGNPISDNATVVVSTPGIYTLFVTDIDNGCSSSSSVEINEDVNLPNAEAGENALLDCIVSEVTLDGSGSSGGPNLSYEWQNSSMVVVGDLPSITVLETDVYTLIVTNLDNGCTASDVVEVNPDFDTPTADAGLDGLLTCIDTQVTLDGSASTGSDSLSYEWFDENNNFIGTDTTLSVDISGDYILVVTDLYNGCTESSLVAVNEDVVPPSADAGENTSLTCDVTEVTLTGSGSGNPGGVSYEWQDSSGGVIGMQNSVIVTETGIYTLIVTDNDNGCTSTSDVEVIPDVNLPNADAGNSSTLTCVINEVTLDGSNSSSGANFSYEWQDDTGTPISMDQNTTVSNNGIYTLIVTDNDNGCTAAASVEIFEDVVTPTADAGQNGILTCDITEITLDGSGSSGLNLSYEWLDESSQPVGNQMVIQVDETGVYTLVVTETSNGCTAASMVAVTPDDNLPTPVTIPDGILTCGNTSVLIDGSSSTSVSGNLSYEWQDAVGNTISIDDNITVLDPGNYILIITDLDNGCTASTTEFIDQDIAEPIVDAGESQTLTCTETAVTLTGSGSNGNNLAYEWFDENNVSISNINTVDVFSDGTYTLFITNMDNGCSASSDVVVLSNTVAPAAEAGTAESLTCVVLDVTLDGSASSTGQDFTYEWQDESNAVIGTTIQISVVSPGAYTLIVTDQINGCTSEDEVVVLEDILPPGAFINTGSSTDLDCDNSSTVLDGTGSSPANQLTFEWTTVDGNILSGTNSPNPEIDAQGTYTLIVTNLINGCTDTETIFINQDITPPIAFINPAQTLTCDLTEFELDATGSSANGNFSYSWTSNPAGGIVSGGNTLQPSIDQPGTYTIVVFNEDNGCESNAEIVVNQNIDTPTAIANVEDQFDCVIESLNLDGTGSSEGPTFIYNWIGNGIIDNPSSLLPTVYEPGLYTIVVTDVGNGCTETAAILVEQDEDVPSSAEIQVGEPPCFGDPASIAILSVDGGDSPYLYSIDGGENYSSSNFFNSLSSGTYDILIQDAKGCEYEDEIIIPFVNEVIVNAGPDVILQLGELNQLNAQLNIPLTEVDTIMWSPTTGLDCTDCLNPNVEILNEMLYTITVININGCVTTDQVMLRVDKTREVFIPNAFSPNNDGINDKIMIFANAEKIKQINTFKIFDRWGEIVYEAFDFQPNDPNFGWDGIFKEQKLNPAVFVYFAEIEFIDDVTQVYKGDVTLME